MSIVLDQISKRYGRQPIVDRVSLEVADGELFVLLGPSGSGKSTILRIIAGLTQRSRSQVALAFWLQRCNDAGRGGRRPAGYCSAGRGSLTGGGSPVWLPAGDHGCTAPRYPFSVVPCVFRVLILASRQASTKV